jgi:hypothetical protein
MQQEKDKFVLIASRNSGAGNIATAVRTARHGHHDVIWDIKQSIVCNYQDSLRK